MPLVNGVSNSFIDVAIKDEKEVNPIVDASRRQSLSVVPSNGHQAQSATRSHSMAYGSSNARNSGDATFWRAKNDPLSIIDCSRSVLSHSIKSQNHEEDKDDQSVSAQSFSAYSVQSTPYRKQYVEDDCRSVPVIGGRAVDLTGSLLDLNSSTGNRTTIIANRVLELEQHQEPNQSEENKDLILEIEKLKMEYAEAQSKMDWYNLRYRHLYVEFTDLQAFCKKLQSENIELREENTKLKGKVAKKYKPWFKVDNLTRLTTPQKLENHGSNVEWDNETITTQQTFTTRSSRDRSQYNGNNTIPFEKPNNIIVATNENGNSSSSRNSISIKNSWVNETNLRPQEEEEEKEEEEEEEEGGMANSAVAKEDESQGAEEKGDDVSYEVPSEVDDQPKKEQRESHLTKHRFLPRRGSLFGAMERRGSTYSIYSNSTDMEEMNLNDSNSTSDDPSEPECNSNSTPDVNEEDFRGKSKVESIWRFPWRKNPKKTPSDSNDDHDNHDNHDDYDDYDDYDDKDKLQGTSNMDDDSELSEANRGDILVELPIIPKQLDDGLDECSSKCSSRSATSTASSIDMPNDLSDLSKI